MSKKTLCSILLFSLLALSWLSCFAYSPTLTFYEDYETGGTSKRDGYLDRSGVFNIAGTTYKYNGTYGGYHYASYSGAAGYLPWGTVSYKYINYTGKNKLYYQQQYRINSFMVGFRDTQFMCFLLLGTYQASPMWQNGGTYNINGLTLRAGIFKNSTGYYVMVDLPTIYADRYFSSSTITFNAAQWYLYEVLIQGQSINVKINGSSVLNASLDAAAFQITNVGMVYWGCYCGWYPTNGGSNIENIAVWDDNIYFADDLPDIYYTLSITALNVAHSSSISVPMKINDAEYYTPISASLTSGIYIIQPEDYGFNTTHYWRFVNWTDGADRTRTINFTGPASYTAYYQLAKIQSWGGYFNFFLGLAGLGMMASSWFVLKWQWDEKNYGVAILTWMLLLIVGFALCTILFGG